ncbi:M23 family metallopeptidase [Flavobacterium sp. CS20]|uniref:M23 family metallopeptidase n=1 Tax=Flavobacterium sp. CS20 TaxID=2775246 RepID=UPI001B39EC53|nr:M23 family metallopeptidase [Flavobacterium sp. CS20]QTY28012.1 M23 family metallopeptidase [Flavobacterium sp. CS20]
MKNKIQLFIIFMVFSICFISCQKDDVFQDTQNENPLDLKSVSSKDIAQYYNSFSQNAKSDQAWLTPYFEYNDSISIVNSNAKITVTPAITDIPNAYSRLFSLNINSQLKTVAYHMFPNDQATSSSFFGGIMITDLSGNLLSAFEAENNLYTKYYDVATSDLDLNILDLNSKSGDCPDDPNCFDGGMLDEVVIVADPPKDSASITIIFLPEFINQPEDGNGGFTIPTTPTEPSAPATDTNEDTCPPGKIKDNNGNCVEPDEPCPGIKIKNSSDECICPNGFVEAIDGSCVEVPCDKDPVKNPKVAKQNLSGIEGGLFGCTRNGSGCQGQPNKKKHGGLDVLNSFGSPVFAMYDGVASLSPNELNRAGWVVVLFANVDGVSTKIQYFHLQQNNRANGSVSAGDIIGYQGDSGNLDEAIAKGFTESHVHIKVENDQGLQNPEDYIGNLTTEDESITISNPDCN